MTGFAEAFRESRGNDGEGLEYYYRFINQFIKIPKSVSDKVNTDHSDQNIGVRYCIGLILTNLLNGHIAYSRDDKYYTKHRGKYYGYTYMLDAVELVVKDKYAINKTGTRDSSFEFGIASRLYKMDKVDQTFPKELDPPLDFKTIPLLQIDKRRIYTNWDLNKYVTSTYTSSTTNTSSTPHSHSPLTSSNTLSHKYGNYAQSFSESQTLNRKYFNNMTLDFSKIPTLRFLPLEQVCLTRIYNNDECGRWYQKGGLSYQQLSEEERALILLNGSEVIELDYTAMHPHLLYAWEGQQCPSDFYEQIANQLDLEYNDDTKFVVKRVTLSSINASGETNLQKSIAKDKRDEVIANTTRRSEGRAERPILYDELKRLNLDFKQIVEAFSKANPIIAKYVYSGSANKLMLEESTIMTKVLFELMNNKIPALPVHDSVIVPAQKKSTVEQIMLDEYKNHTGFTINVK